LSEAAKAEQHDETRASLSKWQSSTAISPKAKRGWPLTRFRWRASGDLLRPQRVNASIAHEANQPLTGEAANSHDQPHQQRHRGDGEHFRPNAENDR